MKLLTGFLGIFGEVSGIVPLMYDRRSMNYLIEWCIHKGSFYTPFGQTSHCSITIINKSRIINKPSLIVTRPIIFPLLTMNVLLRINVFWR